MTTTPHPTPAAILPELLDLIRFQQEYIVAIPSDVAASLPAMPGFDGDWAVDLVERAKALAASPNTTASGATNTIFKRWPTGMSTDSKNPRASARGAVK